MINKYLNGKVYKIVSEHTDKVYIGSTINKLSKRLSSHKSDYIMYLNNNRRFRTSFNLIKLGNVKIYLIEECPCENKNQLERRERHFIETMNCVNKYIPTRTAVEYYLDNKEKYKEYYLDNRDIILIKQKEKSECPICKSMIRKNDIKRHQQSKKCQSHIT